VVSASGIALEGFCGAAGDDAVGRAERGHTVDIRGVTHRYGAITAVNDVTLIVKAGEIMALLGPSGCGKTTLLKVVAGFVRQSSGSVLIDRRAIDDLPPNMRAVGIVFQNYALFPHMTVAENIAYGLKARGRQAVNSSVSHSRAHLPSSHRCSSSTSLLAPSTRA
jgi:ABC-type Fe3+/spermidine/putrescine transport system ATPase subunit